MATRAIPTGPNWNPAFTGPVLLRKQTQWFDPNAFTLPTVGTWGNAGRGILTGPGLANLDLSLSKNTTADRPRVAAVPGRVFQYAESPQLRDAQPYCLHGRQLQFLGGPDH